MSDVGYLLTGIVTGFATSALSVYSYWLITFRDRQDRLYEQQRRLTDAADAAQAADLRVTMAKDVLPEPSAPRYEVLIDDWGPDFTGEFGALHRWRWAVVDADAEVRRALGLEVAEVGTVDKPFMLGNEATFGLAWVAASAWIERQRHPVRMVTSA